MLNEKLDNIRYSLTPQIKEYDKFVDRANTRWLPFLMYFHQTNYSSEVINTDSQGFRFSFKIDKKYSPNTNLNNRKVNLLIGSSTVFGVGATSDDKTLPSQLNNMSKENDAVWLNFGGRGFNSTQELILFLLHRHQLPQIENIVIMSGINNLVLSRFSFEQDGGYGSFFFSGEYYQQMNKLRAAHKSRQMSIWKRIVNYITNGKQNYFAQSTHLEENIELRIKRQLIIQKEI